MEKTVTDIRLAVKVDVDTYVGTREGVARLRDMFDARGIKASFFLSLGPDNSGKAIWRIFTRPGFLTKQLRTKAPGAYGFKTMLMGTLLRAPIIGYGQSELVRSLFASGHEVGLHAWDHVGWHDRLWKMKPEEIDVEIQKGVSAFSSLAGACPAGFAAPAWRINAAAAKSLKKAGMTYTSATRGYEPYYPAFSGQRVDLLEIPTTLPTADEVLGTNGIDLDLLSDHLLSRILTPGLHVLTVHAEMEGRGLAKSFERTLDVCLARRVTFVRLMDIAREYSGGKFRAPEAEVVRNDLPGRPGKVSCQSR